MNWISIFGESLVISGISQICICMTWLIALFMLNKHKNARVIYNLHRLVMLVFVLPIGYAYIKYRLATIKDGTTRWFPSVSYSVVQVHEIIVKCYIAIMLVVILYFIIQVIKLTIRCRRRQPANQCEMDILDTVKAELGIRRKIRLYKGELVFSPFIVGAFRPCIYLPIENFSDEEMSIIFRHELYHYKQGDTFWRPVLLVGCLIYAYNPFSLLMFMLFGLFAELSCDYRCCVENNYSSKKYFSSIMDMAEKMTGRNIFLMPNWCDGKRELRWRITFMKKYNKARLNVTATAFLAIAVLFVGGISVAAAEKKVEDCYEAITDATFDEEKLPYSFEDYLASLPTLLEDTQDDSELIVIQESDESILLSGVKGIEWTVENGVKMISFPFTCTAGGDININIDITPANKTVKLGIVFPDGSSRYVNVSGKYNYFLNITTAGSYRYYITNNSGVTVNVSGWAGYR